MAKIIKKLKREQSGFTLIEVLVAVAILALLGVALLGGLTLSSETLLRADTQETARDVAEAQMENIQSQAYQTTAPAYAIMSLPANYSIVNPTTGQVLTTIPAQFINQDGTLSANSTDTGLQKITIKVVGPKGNFTLTDYKVDY